MLMSNLEAEKVGGFHETNHDRAGNAGEAGKAAGSSFLLRKIFWKGHLSPAKIAVKSNALELNLEYFRLAKFLEEQFVAPKFGLRNSRAAPKSLFWCPKVTFFSSIAMTRLLTPKMKVWSFLRS